MRGGRAPSVTFSDPGKTGNVTRGRWDGRCIVDLFSFRALRGHFLQLLRAWGCVIGVVTAGGALMSRDYVGPLTI